MIPIDAYIDKDRNLIIGQHNGFVGETYAEMIKIDLGPFREEVYDFFVLNFDNGITGGTFPSNIIRNKSDTPVYIDTGIIYCPIFDRHTASGTLKIQLEAHRSIEGYTTVRKSSVACITFDESIMGKMNILEESNPIYEQIADTQNKVVLVEDRMDIVEDRMGTVIRRMEEYGSMALTAHNSVNELTNRIISAEKNFDSLDSRIDFVDGRISKIENANYGGSISSINSRLSKLETHKRTTDESIRSVSSRISLIESYSIPETFEGVNQRIEELENAELPVAGSDTLGCVKVENTSELSVSEEGSIRLRYSNIDMHSLSILLTVALLNETGRIETVVGETADSISSFVYSATTQIISGSIEAIVFAVFGSGEIIWLDENYEEKSSSVRPNAVYIIRMVDEKMVFSSYEGTELRGLILEGI